MADLKHREVSFWWTALLLLLLGVALGYCAQWNSHHATPTSTAIITTVHVAFLLFVLVAIVRRKGDVAARIFLGTCWVMYVALIVRGFYLLFRGD